MHRGTLHNDVRGGSSNQLRNSAALQRVDTFERNGCSSAASYEMRAHGTAAGVAAGEHDAIDSRVGRQSQRNPRTEISQANDEYSASVRHGYPAVIESRPTARRLVPDSWSRMNRSRWESLPQRESPGNACRPEKGLHAGPT
jgi:hypothetical protein